LELFNDAEFPFCLESCKRGEKIPLLSCDCEGGFESLCVDCSEHVVSTLCQAYRRTPAKERIAFGLEIERALLIASIKQKTCHSITQCVLASSWQGEADEPASEAKPWNELTEEERAVAEKLGYDEDTWDG